MKFILARKIIFVYLFSKFCTENYEKRYRLYGKDNSSGLRKAAVMALSKEYN